MLGLVAIIFVAVPLDERRVWRKYTNPPSIRAIELSLTCIISQHPILNIIIEFLISEKRFKSSLNKSCGALRGPSSTDFDLHVFAAHHVPPFDPPVFAWYHQPFYRSCIRHQPEESSIFGEIWQPSRFL